MEHSYTPTTLTTIPLELLRIILDKVYEEPQTLTVTKTFHSTPKTTSSLPTTPLLLNRHIHNESLDAIHRSTNNSISLTLYATLSDLTPHLSSPALASFLPTVTTLNLTDFPYNSTILKSWKETCPNLRSITISHVYSPAASAAVHRTLMTPNLPSLLRGDADTAFAEAAISRILAVHPTFHLDDLADDMTLTFPNVVDFWSDRWEQEYYHANRVLILSLSITKTRTYISQKSFKNRLRNIEYRPKASCKELPRFPGVDYEVRYAKEGNVKNPDYDWRKDCFCSPYS